MDQVRQVAKARSGRWRFEVTATWGQAPANLQVGSVIRDKGPCLANRTWELFDLTTGQPTGGWSGRCLGPADD